MLKKLNGKRRVVSFRVIHYIFVSLSINMFVSMIKKEDLSKQILNLRKMHME